MAALEMWPKMQEKGSMSLPEELCTDDSAEPPHKTENRLTKIIIVPI